MNLRLKQSQEQGFTLIELLVVILIIGVLATIAVPMFLNQRKSAVKASVESDLKSAATVMETESLKARAYPSYLPNYHPRTPDVSVTLDKTGSSSQQFCLRGTSESNPEIVLYYDSMAGGLLRSGQSCSTPPAGQSFSAALTGKKALIIHGGDAKAITLFKNYGFGTVDTLPNNTATADDLKGYDVVVAFATWGPLNLETEALLLNAYNSGQAVFTDGNDISKGVRGWMFEESKQMGSGYRMYFEPTGNTGLSPSFPYNFREQSFGSDGHWFCNTKVKPGTVVLATSPTEEGYSCATAVGANNGAGGRWIHLSYHPETSISPTSINAASLDWLLM